MCEQLVTKNSKLDLPRLPRFYESLYTDFALKTFCKENARKCSG